MTRRLRAASGQRRGAVPWPFIALRAIRLRAIGLLAIGLLAGASEPALAEPYVPSSDDVVLEVLAGPQGRHWDQIRHLRAAVDRNPSDAESVAELARAYAEVNATTGEPRYLGYAAAALEPWRDVQEPPLALWLIRARVDQRLHRFASAQADLEALLRAHPADPGAALLLSTVAIVRSDYPAALDACRQLMKQGQSLVAILCAANLAPYVGRAASGLRTVEALLGPRAIPTASLQSWALTLAAELAVGLGDARAAHRYYRAALDATEQAGEPDLYLIGSYADLLMDEGHFGDALELLDDAPATDSLLIRRAIAAAAHEGTPATDLQRRLEQRMVALDQRADDAHAREQAWYYLHVAEDAVRALPYAQRNWTLQHEMRDARLLLEAAHEADQIEAARPVVEWISTQQIDHAWLNDLAARWRARVSR